MQWLESRIRLLEDRFKSLYRWLLDMQQQLRAVQQGLISTNQQGSNPTNQSASSGVYFVMAPSTGTINGAWSGSTMTGAGSFSGTVYQLSNGTITSMGSQTVYNGLPAALANSKACVCLPDGAGNYVVVSQSCT